VPLGSWDATVDPPRNHLPYSVRQAYSIQQLHITPRAEAQQSVLSWQISTPGHCHAYTDAYGNLSHMLTLNEPHELVAIVAHGVVATTLLPGGRLDSVGQLSPLIFSVPTRLTEPTDAVRAFAADYLPNGAGGVRTDDLMALAARIFGALAYQNVATSVDTTAHDALLLGVGVCQDHAHLFWHAATRAGCRRATSPATSTRAPPATPPATPGSTPGPMTPATKAGSASTSRTRA
jgi:transglutaminase-like putative cysteine protease